MKIKKICELFLFPELKTERFTMIFLQLMRPQMLKHIHIDDLEEFMRRLVDCSKRCFELNANYFELKISFKHSKIRA